MTEPGYKPEESRAPGDVKTPPPDVKAKTLLSPGAVLANNYEILSLIGEGGMAYVYQAMQKSLNRLVAVKALHPKLSRDSEFVERFEAESGALAALSHPNIVNIIDRGREAEIYYFIMEYIDGETLDEKIIENRLTPNDWRQVIAACGDALDYIHKRGMVHRDIKPSNILVTKDGRVKIGDFGIAHIISGDRAGEAQPASASGRQMGTTHYMAPEQIMDSTSVDHRADIYSLGVAFYKMISRQIPVGEFPAPSEVNREVPVAVDAVVYQAMAPDRDARYQSAKEFCDDLLRALREQSLNISAILKLRSASGSSSLYTGLDFKTPLPVQSPEGKKAKSSTGLGKSPPRSNTPPPVKARDGWVPFNRDLTPMPIPRVPDPGYAPRRERSGIRYMVGGVVIAVVVIIIVLVLTGAFSRKKTMDWQDQERSLRSIER